MIRIQPVAFGLLTGVSVLLELCVGALFVFVGVQLMYMMYARKVTRFFHWIVRKSTKGEPSLLAALESRQVHVGKARLQFLRLALWYSFALCFVFLGLSALWSAARDVLRFVL